MANLRAPFKSEAVVCTRNRPHDIDRFLRTYIGIADAPPLLIVDSSDDAATEATVSALTTGSGFSSIRHVRSLPGLTRQRMHGVSLLGRDTDLVHFLDDDTVLESDYFQQIEDCFEADNRVLGACGCITNMPAYACRWPHRLFLLAGLTPGAVLPSGVGLRQFPVADQSGQNVTRVGWLPGCCMSYRCSVFERVSFDTRMEGYCLGEDLDFSFRVGRSGRLVAVRGARLEHLCSPVNRLDALALDRDALIFRYRWVSEMRGNGLLLSAFWWSLTGLAIGSASALLRRKPNARAHAHFYLSALQEILRAGRIPRNPRLRRAASRR